MSFENITEKEILDIGIPIMDNLMEASTNIDHEKHTQDFSDRMKNIVTKEHFESVCRQYQNEKGLFTKREIVAVFKRPSSAAIIWKQQFSKVKGDYVAELVLIKEKNRYLVDHAMVF